jgi:O-antigen ligase
MSRGAELSERLSRARSATFGRADRVGLLLTVGLVGWLTLAGALSEEPALAPAALAAGAAVAFAVGRASAARWRERPALAVVLVAAVLLAWAWPDVVDGRPMGRPLGYANATAALAVQAVAAASILAASSRTRTMRIIGVAAAAAFAAVPFVLGSIAGALLASVVIAVGAFGRLRRWRPLSAVALAVAFFSILLGTVALGATYENDGRASLIEVVLSERRPALWKDALQQIGREPILGVGIGRFDDESQVARSDRDARWAHHEFLQVSAESGLVGGLLLVALVVWAIATTGRDGVDPPRAAIAAAAVAALAVHSCVDYVLRFPIVPVCAAFLLGLSTIAERPSDRRLTTEGDEGWLPVTA